MIRCTVRYRPRAALAAASSVCSARWAQQRVARLRAARFTALAALALGLGLVAKVEISAAQAPQELLASITAADLRAQLGFIASPAFEGRLSTERGGDLTEEYVAAEFGKYGLKPAGTDGSFFQVVPILRYQADMDKTAIHVMTTAGKSSRAAAFRSKTDFMSLHPVDVTVEAPIVFAGYGITAPELGYDDYAGIDVKDKIVIIMDHEPQESDPRSAWNGLGLTLHATRQVKIVNAQKHGAAGVLLANEPVRTHQTTPERLTANAALIERLYSWPRQALAVSDQRIPLFAVMDSVVNEIFSGAGMSLAALQQKIDRTNRPASAAIAGVRVRMTAANRVVERVSARNIVGLIEGEDAQLAADTIVFGAHYDHDGVHDGIIYPGADDDGSGTVGILELAQAFAASGRKPKRSLLFAVWCSEEHGLLGAYHYAAHPLRPLSTTVAMFQFDMIGRDEAPRDPKEVERLKPFDTSKELHLVGASHVPDLHALFAEANKSIGLRLVTRYDEDAAESLYTRSDHFPFVLAGRPALWLFTGFHPDYHQPSDTVEKINFEKMEKIVRLTAEAGWRLANSADQPKLDVLPRAREK